MDDQFNKKQSEVTQWVHQYADDLFAFAFYKTSSKEIAEDIVQETFAAAVHGYENYKRESNAKTWLFRIATNKITDYYRKKSRSFISLEVLHENNAFQASDKLFDQYDSWRDTSGSGIWPDNPHLLDNPGFNVVFEQCFGDLPEAWRMALLSKYILGKDGKEICQELEISPSNYWQILHRAKLLVKNCLEKNWFKKEAK